MADVSASGGLRRSARRLVLVIVIALAGLCVAVVIQGTTRVRVHEIADSAAYGKSITALLAFGLFASVYGISRRELRRNARLVFAAVTLGVTGKAFLTGGVMVLAYGSAGYLLLGVAVAQIDPLSVAASIQDYGMSQRAKSILLAWASFDDPVTVLLVAYLASATLPAIGGHGGSALVIAGGSSVQWQIVLNVALVAIAGLAWYLAAVRAGWLGSARGNVLLCLILLGLIALAVSYGLLVGIAVCGLFFRPRIDWLISRVVDSAFYLATFMLGLLLVTGVHLAAGLLLGASVFAVQAMAGTLIGRGLPRGDRVHLALGQQNGLTAIVLALALEPYLPSAVGIVAIAILVVNILHILGNGIWSYIDKYTQHKERKSPVLANLDPAWPGSRTAARPSETPVSRISS